MDLHHLLDPLNLNSCIVLTNISQLTSAKEGMILASISHKNLASQCSTVLL